MGTEFLKIFLKRQNFCKANRQFARMDRAWKLGFGQKKEAALF
jgi:hypothetical protein